MPLGLFQSNFSYLQLRFLGFFSPRIPAGKEGHLLSAVAKCSHPCSYPLGNNKKFPLLASKPPARGQLLPKSHGFQSQGCCWDPGMDTEWKIQNAGKELRASQSEGMGWEKEMEKGERDELGMRSELGNKPELGNKSTLKIKSELKNPNWKINLNWKLNLS